jgi:hypothetical protein
MDSISMIESVSFLHPHLLILERSSFPKPKLFSTTQVITTHQQRNECVLTTALASISLMTPFPLCSSESRIRVNGDKFSLHPSNFEMRRILWVRLCWSGFECAILRRLLFGAYLRFSWEREKSHIQTRIKTKDPCSRRILVTGSCTAPAEIFMSARLPRLLRRNFKSLRGTASIDRRTFIFTESSSFLSATL